MYKTQPKSSMASDTNTSCPRFCFKVPKSPFTPHTKRSLPIPTFSLLNLSENTFKSNHITSHQDFQSPKPFTSSPHSTTQTFHQMIHDKSETDSTGGCTSTSSSASPKCTYIVQSPSRDSHDDKSSTTISHHTTPTESPSHSMSSGSRVSGPYRFSMIGKHQHQQFLKRKKGWPAPLFSVIDEEDEDYGEDDYYYDRGMTRECRVVMFVVGFVMVFTTICLVTWGASRPYKFQVQMKSWKVNSFYYGEGLDNTGVSTKLLMINCTVKMCIQNPATFFGIHVSSTSLNLYYSRIVVASGQFINYYQPKKSERKMLVNVEGRQVPLYGAGLGLAMANNNGSVPLKLEFEVHSEANLVGWLVKTKHHRRVFCIMRIDSKSNKVINFKEDSCSHS